MSTSIFKGLSTLRAAEQKKAPVTEKSKAMQAYLAAQYGGGDAAAEGDKKKKKKKKRSEAGGPGLKILDQDVSGFVAAAAGAAGKRAPQLGRPGPQMHDDGGDDDDDDDDQGECWEGCAQLERTA